jgi:hypothetical protein
MEPLAEPVDGVVAVLPVVSGVVDEVPLVPDVLLPDIDDEPAIALVNVNAPLVPARHPVSVIVFALPVAL